MCQPVLLQVHTLVFAIDYLHLPNSMGTACEAGSFRFLGEMGPSGLGSQLLHQLQALGQGPSLPLFCRLQHLASCPSPSRNPSEPSVVEPLSCGGRHCLQNNSAQDLMGEASLSKHDLTFKHVPTRTGDVRPCRCSHAFCLGLRSGASSQEALSARAEFASCAIRRQQKTGVGSPTGLDHCLSGW